MLAEPAHAAPDTRSIRIEPLHDEAQIASALRHPRIYPHISDDGCPDADALHVVVDGPMHYLGAFAGEVFLGLFVAHAHNFVLYEVHTCLLPHAWGPRALDAARGVVAWIFGNTPCQRLVTSVPQGNDLALQLARRAGLEVYGLNPRSLMRGGRLLDQTLLGISRE